MDDDDLLDGPILPDESPFEVLMQRFDVLAEIWGDAITRVEAEKWLSNFVGATLSEDDERVNALHLLCCFNLFGLKEVRELLRSIYRDLFKYPIMQCLRDEFGGTLDHSLVQQRWKEELAATRFIPMGNPSESGAHLLYYFRQINSLPKSLFMNQHELLDGEVGSGSARPRLSSLKRVIYIDDVLGSGTQAELYSKNFIAGLKNAYLSEGIELEIHYFVLFAKPEGLRVARGTEFSSVEAVHELDESELAFTQNSRIYVDCLPGVTREKGESISQYYGELLYPGHALGYKNGQLMLGFRHNIPDNTLPIVWCAGADRKWDPAFPRFDKSYE